MGEENGHCMWGQYMGHQMTTFGFVPHPTDGAEAIFNGDSTERYWHYLAWPWDVQGMFFAIVYHFEVLGVAADTAAGSVSGGGFVPEEHLLWLTAEARPGYIFSHWDDGSTTNPRECVALVDTVYTAYFDSVGDYTVSVAVNNEAWGSVSGGGAYPYGSVATLTAEAARGCMFDGWTDGEWNPVRTVTVTRDTQFTALFSVDSTLINGIGEAERLAFTVRPNPTAGLLTVERGSGEPCVAEVYDDRGRRVLRRELTGEVSTLDVSRLPAGHYVLKLNDGKAAGVRGFVKK